MRFKCYWVDFGTHFGDGIWNLINQKASSTNETRLEVTQEILANLLEFLADKKIMSQEDFHKIVDDYSLEFQEEEAG
jgi:hypothetical protein